MKYRKTQVISDVYGEFFERLNTLGSNQRCYLILQLYFAFINALFSLKDLLLFDSSFEGPIVGNPLYFIHFDLHILSKFFKRADPKWTNKKAICHVCDR